ISPEERKGHRKFTELLSLGEEAAARARETVLQQRERQQTSRQGKRVRVPRAALAPAMLIITLLAGSLIGYIITTRQTSEARILGHMRDLYGNTRLLQARVTGGFAHQNYGVTRGSGDLTGVDETQRVALLAEINQEVHTHPKAATRHILGELLLLNGDLDPA